jgi:hypothetical protein
MKMTGIKLLVVITVAMSALAFGARPALAGYNDTPARSKCAAVFRDQLHTDGQPGNRNPNGPRTNCDRI